MKMSEVSTQPDPRWEATRAVVNDTTVDRSSPAAEVLVRAAGHTPENAPQLFAIGTEYRKLFDRFFEQTGGLWAPKGPVAAHYGYEGISPEQLARMADDRVFSLDTLERAVKADKAGHGMQGVFIPDETRDAMVRRMRQHPVEGQRKGDEAVWTYELENDELWGTDSKKPTWGAAIMAMAPEVPDAPNNNARPQFNNFLRAVRWEDHAQQTLGMDLTRGARQYTAAQMQALLQGIRLDAENYSVVPQRLEDPSKLLAAGYWYDDRVGLYGRIPVNTNVELRARVSARSDKPLGL